MLFTRLGIKYTDRWLSDYIEENPYRNTMFGIGVILTRYGVSNRCVRLEDRHDIGLLHPPFIVIADNRFAIVDKVTDSEVTVSFKSS